jgi:hypothetical protein
VAPCFTVYGCNPKLVTAFFTSYLERSERALSEEIQGMMQPWQATIAAVTISLKAWSEAAKSIGPQLEKIGSKVDQLLADLCPNDDECVKNSLVEFKAQSE